MIETFFFKGLESSDFSVAAQSILANGGKSAGARYEKIEVNGRDGAIYVPSGLSDIEREIPCVLLDRQKEDAVRAWLTGSGMLRVGDRQKEIRILDGIEFRVSRGWKHEEFNVHVIEDPCWESCDDWEPAASGIVVNPGTVDAEPWIRITGSGAGTVTVNGTLIGLSLPSDGGTVVIDCKEKDEDHPAWVRLGWVYPSLSPGSNPVSFDGGVSLVELKRRGRWR